MVCVRAVHLTGVPTSLAYVRTRTRILYISIGDIHADTRTHTHTIEQTHTRTQQVFVRNYVDSIYRRDVLVVVAVAISISSHLITCAHHHHQHHGI